MRRRPSARLIVTDAAARILLFRFVDEAAASGAATFWATPGGGVDADESFAQAAVRELREETGIAIAAVGEPIARLERVITWFDGETLLADECYFYIPVGDGRTIAQDGWSAEEYDVIVEHRWWTVEELRVTTDTIFPETLVEIVSSIDGAAR